MNKRIKELRRRATLVETYTANSGTVVESKNVDLEKFAELIIQECAEVINENDFEGSHIGDIILKHFGVEQ